MSVQEQQVLDMTALLIESTELAEMILGSQEMERYLYWKQIMEQDPIAQEAIRQFRLDKEAFADCERFGHFHPDYHAGLERVEKSQEAMQQIETIRYFKEAESALDDLLYQVSLTIARSVSESVKVPSNTLLPDTGTGGCGAGGCSGRCG
ncbi:YlbF family regulator [Xylanibacillus composti]|uniref:Regulator n=1 Tax=Xylanibacillus composti TaxID=1572762 RepID=A0A8J4H0M3_9BACL|nr:YlbF family regulator [Xylanibacillus composti]MDT9724150.1 YlbF family regulator [Xylanibacillus composti]GIQ68699.1 regulator [Xylanibacillus composti]